jgi:hypothetical protein
LRPAEDAVNVTTPFPVPDGGDTDNQEALSLTDQVNGPPVVLIFNDWGVGAVPL